MRLFSTLIIATILTMSSCKKEDLQTTGSGGTGSTSLTGTYLTAKINGTPFQAVEDVNGQCVSSALDDQGSDGFFLQISGDVPAITSVESVVFGFTSENNFADLQAEDEFFLESAEGSNGGGYSVVDVDPYLDFATEGTSSFYVKITAIDHENNTVSGEFNFTAVDEETLDVYEITEGVFNLVPFI